MKYVLQSGVSVINRQLFPLFLFLSFKDSCGCFSVGPLWCNYFGVYRTKNWNTYLIFEPFPSPDTQTFHPIWWFCYFSRSFAFLKCSPDSQHYDCFVRLTQYNNSSWRFNVKHQHIQFVFMVCLRNDSQRSLSYKNGILQKHFPTAYTKKG